MSVSLIDGHIDDDVMTDEQIIKALECHADTDIATCKICAYDGVVRCGHQLCYDALDLINRQKAKIKALQMDNEQLETDNFNANMNCEHIKNIWESDYQKLSEVITKWKDQYKRLVIQEENIKAEAVKEFADRLKAVSHPYADTQMVFELQIDNLVKEMVGAESG